MRVEDYVPELDYASRDWQPFGIRKQDPETGKTTVHSPRKKHFCLECKDYYQGLYDRGVTQKPFPVSCEGDRRLAVRKLRRDTFADEAEFELAKSLLDPVSWARYFIDFETYWYQTEMVCCSAQSRVNRCGRRAGKSEAMALECLWKLYTRPGFQILLVCPYESQVDLFMRKIRDHIAKSDIIGEQMRPPGGRNVMTAGQQLIQFRNGAAIRGFSCGAGSSARSDKIRGQPGDMIVFDEADYIDDGDLETIMAIKIDKEWVEVYASSTPRGIRKSYHNWCVNKDRGYKEFHFTSLESPNWTEDVELELRTQYSQGGFLREFLAEFGEEVSGVFKSADIDACLKSYKLPYPIDRAEYHVALGVDWNKLTGTHLVVVGLHKSAGVLRVIDKEVIRRQEFTQHAGVAAVLKLDKRWRPDVIYVDAGYGSMQVESLHRMDDWKGTDYKKRLKAIDMGGMTDIIDPLTKLPAKKPTKALMVDISVRLMEARRFELPRSEDTTQRIIESEIPFVDVGLVQQMRAFHEERRSPTGKVIYSDDYEHTLTAFMLAVMGLEQKFGNISKRALREGFETCPTFGKQQAVPTTDEKGNPLPPSLVAIMKEAERQRVAEEEDEAKRRLQKLRVGTTRATSSDVPQANADGDVLVAVNGKAANRTEFSRVVSRRFGGSYTGRRTSWRRR